MYPEGCGENVLLVREAAGLHHALGLFVDVVVQVRCGEVWLISAFDFWFSRLAFVANLMLM